MKFVELFAGAGGISLGLLRAGLLQSAAYDCWPVAVENHRRNVSEHISEADLSNPLKVIAELLVLQPDVVVGGPPCQDFSGAGLRKAGDNANLTLAFASIVVAARPSWFLMENVIQAKNFDIFRLAVEMYKKAGYGLSVVEVDASRFGIAQRRRRLIVIGRHGERDGFLDSAVTAAASAERMTVREFFTNVNITRHPEDQRLLDVGYFYARPLHAGRGVRSIDEPMSTITRTSWERPTARYTNNPHPDDPIPATEAVVLSMRQLSMLQGFPEDYEWRATAKRDIYQMVANAVPAPLAEALGQVILAREFGHEIPRAEGRFVRWLRRHGKSPATARQIRSNVNTARRLLKGRIHAELAIELAVLETSLEFQALSGSRRSALRRALILHAEYLDYNAEKTVRKGRMRRDPAAPAVVGPDVYRHAV